MDETVSRIKFRSQPDGGGVGIMFTGLIFGRNEQGWWFRDSGNGDRVYRDSRESMMSALRESVMGICDGCGQTLRRSEGDGVCSDCHEQRRLGDIDDDEFEAAREAKDEVVRDE